MGNLCETVWLELQRFSDSSRMVCLIMPLVFNIVSFYYSIRLQYWTWLNDPQFYCIFYCIHTQLPLYNSWFRHRWIHHQCDEPPTEGKRLPQYDWMEKHEQNWTGTSRAYMPWSTTRPKIQAWTPPEWSREAAPEQQASTKPWHKHICASQFTTFHSLSSTRSSSPKLLTISVF